MIKSSYGFTIPELLLSSVVMGFIFIATITVYIMLNKIWQEDLALNNLARDTNIAVDRITRGLHGNEGLLAAKEISSPLTGLSSDIVQYKDYNNISRTFYYSNNKIYAGDGTQILSDVVSASFYNVDDAVLQMDLVTHKYVVNKEIRFRLETKIKRRN